MQDVSNRGKLAPAQSRNPNFRNISSVCQNRSV